MNLAPIVIFSYNRPDHLQRVLDALAKNDLANQSLLYIYCDGAKKDATDEQKILVKKNREIARAIKGFKEVIVIDRPYNLGLKANIVNAVTEIINKHGRIITLEDDVVTSTGFLKYMNDALECYKDDEKVMHISAYMWPHRWPLPETFFFEVPYPGGGWATWKRAWDNYSDDTAELYDYWKDNWEQFNKFGADYLQKQLIANYYGYIQTWFIKWHAVMLRLGALTLYPGRSLTNNIGFDTSATNCHLTNKFNIKHLADNICIKRRPINESRLGAHEIYIFYQGRWYNKRRRVQLMRKICNTLHID